MPTVKKAPTAVEDSQVKTRAVPEPAPAAPAVKADTGRGFPVAEGESPWSPEEVAEVRDELTQDIDRMEKALAEAEAELTALLAEGGDGAGRDPADVGSANFERDQEMSLNANVKEMLGQSQRALQRLDDGSYGSCEVCGNPIGKVRLLVFPRATMCVGCKQREERR